MSSVRDSYRSKDYHKGTRSRVFLTENPGCYTARAGRSGSGGGWAARVSGGEKIVARVWTHRSTDINGRTNLKHWKVSWKNLLEDIYFSSRITQYNADAHNTHAHSPV
jgi:hypothetical protein